MESNEEALSKIDGVITDIRMINLHLHNFLSSLSKDDPKEHQNQKRNQDFHRVNTAHFQEYIKRVSDYLKKSLLDMQKSKVVLSPVLFRAIRKQHQQQNFLRFQNQVYGNKFIISNLNKQAVLHIQLYRKVRGGRLSSTALRKLQITFTADLSLKLKQGMPSLEVLQRQGKLFLDELTAIMSGQVCSQCQQHLSFNPELKVYLPPTLREVDEPKDSRVQLKRKRAYYHESCL